MCIRDSYKEYLVNIINQHGLDPVTIYEIKFIKLMLSREEMEPPEQEDDEDDQQYRDRLIQVFDMTIPLGFWGFFKQSNNWHTKQK